MDLLRGAVGLLFIIGVAVLLSSNRRAIDWRLVGMGVVIQILFGLIISRLDVAREVFDYVSSKFVIFLSFAQKGGEFLYGDLSKNSNGNPDVRHNRPCRPSFSFPPSRRAFISSASFRRSYMYLHGSCPGP
jgi:CNT family concentrative nucleoside transporter